MLAVPSILIATKFSIAGGAHVFGIMLPGCVGTFGDLHDTLFLRVFELSNFLFDGDLKGVRFRGIATVVIFAQGIGIVLVGDLVEALILELGCFLFWVNELLLNEVL